MTARAEVLSQMETFLDVRMTPAKEGERMSQFVDAIVTKH